MRFSYTPMELRHLRYFVMAAEEANISRAAARLNVSQPAVSRRIRDLESELEVTLFDREPQGLRLTSAGEVALGHARTTLRDSTLFIDSMRAFSQKGRKTTLRIGFIPTALPGLLSEGLRAFHRTQPDVCIQITEMPPGQQIMALRRGDLDLALPGAASAKVKAEFFTRSLRTTPLAMVVPSDHPFAQKRSVELAEFANDTFLSLNEDRFPGREKMHQRLFAATGLNPSVALHATGLNELLGHVGSGAGVAMVPADLNRIQSSGVTFLKLRRPTMTFNFSAVWQDSKQRIAVEAFVDVLDKIDES